MFLFAVPEELNYDVITGQYTDIRKRPELNCSSIEFIAPSEYMVYFVCRKYCILLNFIMNFYQ